MNLVSGIVIAFHRAFEMGHERRPFNPQIVIVFFTERPRSWHCSNVHDTSIGI